MSSEGTGSPITLQVTMDLLHKLSTESRKVQALFTSADGRTRASLAGVIRYVPDGTLWVLQDPETPGSPFLGFDPALFVVRKYGDERSMLGGGEGPFGLHFRSALTFIFGDGSTLGLFEFADTDAARD